MGKKKITFNASSTLLTVRYNAGSMKMNWSLGPAQRECTTACAFHSLSESACEEFALPVIFHKALNNCMPPFHWQIAVVRQPEHLNEPKHMNKYTKANNYTSQIHCLW